MTWHPICDVRVDFPAPWIVPIFVVPPPEWDPCYWKHNYWIETQPIVDGDWYGFMNDDDGYEPNVMDMIRSKTSSHVVVISMKRGHHVPPDEPHGTSTLKAAPENMRLCSVGVQQLFVRGYVLRTMRFVNDHFADGLMVESVTRRFATTYEPNYYAQFNRFQPGRWDTGTSATPAHCDPSQPAYRLRQIRYTLLRTWVGLRAWVKQSLACVTARKSTRKPKRLDDGG